MYDYIKVEIETFDHQRVEMLWQTSQTFTMLQRQHRVCQLAHKSFLCDFYRGRVAIHDLQ